MGNVIQKIKDIVGNKSARITNYDLIEFNSRVSECDTEKTKSEDVDIIDDMIEFFNHDSPDEPPGTSCLLDS